MKLPWSSDKTDEKETKIRELESKISELQDQKESWKSRFEAEEERRKKLSREKQKAEEELNRLKDKLRNEKSEETVEKVEIEESKEFEQIGFNKAVGMLKKLDSMESDEKDLVTIYSPRKIDNLEDIRAVKNSVSAEQFSEIEGLESFAAFLDEDTGNTLLRMNPFFESKFVLERFFDIADLLEFVRSEKYWVLVSAGNTKVIKEKNGSVEVLESVKSRVDREHSKGGFSQSRFERKRDEQIQKHVKQVSQVLEGYDSEEVYLLGEKKLCEELPGKYLGGFDPNEKMPEKMYQFRLKRF